MNLLRWLLFPFAIIYDLVTRFRNHLYNIGYKKSFGFQTVLINVGNLSVGGTGKTPMIEYLIRLLKDRYKLTTLSRGYGRATKGFRLAGEEDSAKTLGDEPYQFYLNFKESIGVAVGEERAMAIPEILFHYPDNEIILLDDAYQHRTVVPDLNILLTEYNNPFYNDYLMPSGRLREARKGASRASIIIVTKCPGNLPSQEMNEIANDILKYAKRGSPVFFSKVLYKNPEKVYNEQEHRFSENVMLFSGIANSSLLEEYVKGKFNLIRHFSFSDHHNYDKADIEKLKSAFMQSPHKYKCLLTTEKDMVKLLHKDIKPLISELPVFYIPVETEFIQDKHRFEELVLQAIQKARAELK